MRQQNLLVLRGAASRVLSLRTNHGRRSHARRRRAACATWPALDV